MMMDNPPSNKNITDCPECGAELRLKKAPFRGQIVDCRRCGVRLKVFSKQPLLLQWADSPWEDEVEGYPDSPRGTKRR